MSSMNRRMVLVLVVILAIVSVIATGLAYVMNKGRRQKVLLEKAETSYANGDYARAILHYKRVVSLGNATGDMYYRSGLCLEKLRQRRAAFAAFARAAVLDPDHVGARKRLAPIYHAQARATAETQGASTAESEPVRRLEECGRTLIRLRPTESEGYLWLARAQQLKGDKGDLDDALKTLEQARAQNPGDEDVIAEKVRLLTQGDRLDDAEEEIQKALKAQPDSAVFLLARAALYRKTDRVEEEQQDLLKVVDLDPKSVDAHVRLGDFYWRRMRVEEAERELLTVCKLRPEQVNGWVVLARFYLAIDQSDKALDALGKAHALDPGNQGRVAEMARVQIHSRKLDAARASIASIEKMGPATPYVSWLKGLLAVAERKPATAKSRFREALRKSSADFAEADYSLGACYLEEGNYGAAEEQFIRAGRSPQARLRAPLALAEVYLWERQPEKALAQCAQVERLLRGMKSGGPAVVRRHVMLRTLVGRIHLAQGDMDLAEQDFNSALASAKSPADKVKALSLLARTSLTRSLLSRGDQAAAERRKHLKAVEDYLQQGKALAPGDPDLLILEAAIARHQGDADKALALLRDAVKSPGAAARVLREHLTALRIRGAHRDVAEMVADLLATYGDDAVFLGAASDHFAIWAADRVMKARALGGKERDAMLQEAREAAESAIEYARNAFNLEPENKFFSVRLFGLLRTAKRTEKARELADQLADMPGRRPLGLAFQGLLLYYDEAKKDEGIQRLKESVSLDDRNWRTHFWLGRAYAAIKGQAGEAELSLKRALDLRPTATQARDLLFRVLEDQGELARLQQEVEKSLKSSPGDVLLLARSARLSEKMGDLEKAVALWKRVTDIAPRAAGSRPNGVRLKRAPLAMIEYARLLSRLGRADDAVRVAQKAAEQDEYSVRTVRALVAANLAARHSEHAQRVLRDALKARPDNVALHVLARDMYRVIGRPADAEAELKQLVQKRKNDSFPHFLLGQFYEGQARYEEAARKYERSLDLKPNFVAAEMRIIYARLAQARSSNDDAERERCLKNASDRIAKVRDRFPRSLAPRLAEAELLTVRGEMDKAEAHLRGLAEDFADNASLKIGLGKLYYTRGKVEEAIGELEGVLAQDPQTVDAHLLLARIHVDRNLLSRALKNCRDALTYQPAHVPALNLAAQIEVRRGNVTEAARYMKRVVELRPRDRVALFRLVQALLTHERKTEAVRVARDAYVRNPGAADFLSEYVRVLRSVGRIDRAEALCKTFLRAYPDSAEAAFMLAQIQFERGNGEAAGRSLHEAETRAKNANLFLSRAVRVCLRAKQYEKAVAFATRLAASRPDDPYACATLLAAQKASGLNEQAVQTALDAAHRHPDSLAFLRLATRTLSDAGNVDQAEKECTAFASRNPKAPLAFLMLAEVQMNAGRTQAAAASLKQVEDVAGETMSSAVSVTLVRAYTRMKEYENAERIARRLCERSPQSGTAWLEYAAVLESQGRGGREKAIPVYRRALARGLKTGASGVALANNLAYALAVREYDSEEEKARVLAEAESLAQSVLGDRNTAPTHLLDTLGWIKFLRSNGRQARDLLELAVGRRDASAEVWYHYAMACARTGRAKAALEAVGKAVKGAPDNDTRWRADVEAETARNQEQL